MQNHFLTLAYDYRKYLADSKVASPQCFKRYFSLSLEDDAISASVISRLFNSAEMVEVEETIQKCNSSGKIVRLIETIDCLNPITEFTSRVNIFDVLGLKDMEIRHSFMLAWLCDPNENHGLGDRVLRGIIQQVCGDVEMDYSSFLVERETRFRPSWLYSNSTWIICNLIEFVNIRKKILLNKGE